jgi:hypothetical protein
MEQLATSGYSYHDMEPSTGGLFRISGPQDWMEKEKYDFDWSVLKKEEEPFGKIDYDQIA